MCYMLILSKLYMGYSKAALFIYKTFVKVLKEIIFKLNPYEPCVVKIILNY